MLTWETAEERNVLNFEIERSTSGQIFEKIGTVKAKGSNSIYDFLDASTPPLGVGGLYYRLKINDLDGTTNFSKIISLEKAPFGGLGAGGKIQVFPNPTTGILTIDMDILEAVSTTLTISDILGRSIKSERLTTRKGLNTFNINLSNIPKGTYFLTVNDGQTQHVEKIVKQ